MNPRKCHVKHCINRPIIGYKIGNCISSTILMFTCNKHKDNDTILIISNNFPSRIINIEVPNLIIKNNEIITGKYNKVFPQLIFENNDIITGNFQWLLKVKDIIKENI